MLQTVLSSLPTCLITFLIYFFVFFEAVLEFGPYYIVDCKIGMR